MASHGISVEISIRFAPIWNSMRYKTGSSIVHDGREKFDARSFLKSVFVKNYLLTYLLQTGATARQSGASEER